VFANQTKQAKVTNLRDSIIVDEYIELTERQDMLLDREVTYWFQVSMNELDSREPRFLIRIGTRAEFNFADIESV
jgi:hypothetical protein